MKTIKTKKIAVSLLLCLAIACVMFAIRPFMHSAYAEYSLDIDEIRYETSYNVGDTVTIQPFGTVIDGVQKSATVTVFSPSGIAVSKSSVELSECGRYTVEYKIVSGSTIYKGYKYFNAIYGLYSVTDKYSSAAYDDEDGTIKISLNVGGEFHYNKPIDLSKCSSEESLIEFSVLADVQGENNFKKLFFKFTDTANPDNYIILRVRNNVTTSYDYTRYTSYVAARSADYIFTGYDQVDKRVRAGGEYGTLTTFSFSNYAFDASTRKSTSGETVCKLFLDYAEKKIYVAGETIGTGDKVYSKALVTDLDDLFYVGSAWKGFEKGTAYLSVYAESYFKSSAVCKIRKIGDEDISLNSIVDDMPPAITVDYGDYSENALPYGLVNKPYKIFPATAYDVLSLDTAVNTKVYYNYYSSNKTALSVSNGQFLPKRDGKYTIEYRATDLFGNEAVRLTDVLVKNSATEIVIGNASVSDAYTGDLIEIPVPTVTGDKDLGTVNLKAVAILGTEECEVENWKFRPMKKGSWKIKYIATDYVEREKTKEISFSVQDRSGAVFIDDIDALLPKYFISGNVYTLPKLQSVTFNNGNITYNDASISVSSGSVSGNVFTPSVSGESDNINITYFTGNSKVVYTRPCYKIYDGEDLNTAKLFVAKKGEPVFIQSEYGVSVVTDKNAAFDFINTVLSSAVSAEFSVNSTYNNFNKVSFVLTDSENSDISLKFSFTKDGDYSTFSINDLASFPSKASFVGKTAVAFKFSYEQKTKKVIVDSSGYSVSQTLNGTAFNGFVSDKVYVTVQIEGVSGRSEMFVNMISMHNFNNSGMDYIAPVISVSGNVGGTYSLNQTVELPAAISSDVIDGDVEVFLSVKNGGQYVKDVNGLTLREVPANKTYKIKFSDYGTYQAQYTSADVMGNSALYRRNLIVIDEVAPTLTVSGAVSAKYYVGDSVTLPDIIANDNISTPRTYVYVVTPSLTYEFVSGTTYRPLVAGKYEIVFTALDEEGNMATAKRYFTVYDK